MCGRYAITLPPEAIRSHPPALPDLWRAAELASLLQRRAQQHAASRTPGERRPPNRADALGGLIPWFITTEPSKFAAQFHNRMPLILEPDTWDLWMKGEPDAAAALMKPANEDVLISRPVSKAVNSVKNNSAELLA
jgi:putative SOS response-associated peptidase YedK